MLFRKAQLFIITLALLTGTPALAINPAGQASAPRLYSDSGRGAAAAVQLSAERISRHIGFLSSDKLEGRRAGTPFADEAAGYIEKEFRSYGLMPASSAGFLQPFTFVSAVKLGDQNS